jgi:hypothetical protein
VQCGDLYDSVTKSNSRIYTGSAARRDSPQCSAALASGKAVREKGSAQWSEEQGRFMTQLEAMSANSQREREEEMSHRKYLTGVHKGTNSIYQSGIRNRAARLQICVQSTTSSCRGIAIGAKALRIHVGGCADVSSRVAKFEQFDEDTI